MTTLSLSLQSPSLWRRIDGVTSLVARDRSGSFGVLPGHARMITLIDAGLKRLKVSLQSLDPVKNERIMGYSSEKVVHSVCSPLNERSSLSRVFTGRPTPLVGSDPRR